MNAVVARARACVGTRFRLQGRSIEDGLDCVGVASMAFSIDGLPRDYPLHGGSVERLRVLAEAAGLRPVDRGDARPGDLLLVAPGPRQLHLIISTDRGFVHADAGLRRVVETPGAPPWPVLMIWRNRGS